METAAFQLSRIYAQGWNAAKKLLAEGNFSIERNAAASLNPYRSISESARWVKGFEEALGSRTGSANARSAKLWLPSAHPATGRPRNE